MRTLPSATDLISVVAEAITRGPLTPFEARVCSNALAVAAREIRLAIPADEADKARLCTLLKADMALPELQASLIQAISEGKMTEETPGLMDHLWASALAELAIDQPSYPTLLQITGLTLTW